jgi:hypothetical protein
VARHERASGGGQEGRWTSVASLGQLGRAADETDVAQERDLAGRCVAPLAP